ncbi:MAG: Na+/H+ antiporter subunit D, partial [Planctomycetes bacterium]|nr:Na+/H+ antiporter subunit D [Planctomycetota bacterium]
FALHALGGVLLLAGIALHAGQLNAAGHADPLAFAHFAEMIEGWTSFGWHNAGLWLMLIGMLVNAGAPPFSAWIGDAYPEATESGTVFLSAFTTKTAVFTLMVGFAGVELLIYLGLWMAIYGIIYAILENDMRRILAYSIVNQVGFMLVGVGVGTKLAIDGAAAHAFAHIIYKALLMMSAGSVLHATGRRKCTQLGGLYRTMPVTMWCGIIGALAISSFPLTSGFTTKSMILSGITEQADVMARIGKPHDLMIAAWFILEAASAGVFLHAGIKFPWFVFFQKDSGLRPADPPWNMQTAMVIFAGLCLLLGMFPGPLYAILPYKAEAASYAGVVYNYEYLLSMFGLLLFSGLAFFVLLPMLKRKEMITLDTDWLYRRFFPTVWREVIVPILRGLDHAQKTVLEKLPGRPMGEPRSPLARLGTEWAVSVPVFVVTLMLVIYLVVYFVVLPTA